jgi:hypothetical protein
MRRTYSVVLLFVLWLALATCSISAQEQTDQRATRRAEIEIKPANCERHILILEDAHHAVDKDGLLILIARLGDGENRQDFNRRRLHNARTYLTEYLKLRAPETIITAEGERVKGYGRIELYVGGKLHYVLALKRNADLIVGSCEPAELDDARQKELRLKLYPWRDRNTRRR